VAGLCRPSGARQKSATPNVSGASPPSAPRVSPPRESLPPASPPASASRAVSVPPEPTDKGESLESLRKKIHNLQHKYQRDVGILTRENKEQAKSITSLKRKLREESYVATNIKLFKDLTKVPVPPQVTKKAPWKPSALERANMEEASETRPRLVKVTDTPVNPPPRENLTPKSRVNADISASGIKPRSMPLPLKTRLKMANAFIDTACKFSKSEDIDQKRVALAFLSSSPMKKARLYNEFSRLGIARSTLRRAAGKSINELLKKRVNNPQKTGEIKEAVKTFLERDDNSRMTADKKLVYKYPDGSKVQKRVCTDYTRPLHRKFRSENPEFTVSLTTFRKYRPRHIALSKDLRKRSCLCQYCENTRLILSKISQLTNMEVPLSPHDFCEKYEDGEDVENLLRTIRSNEPGNMVSYKSWQKVECQVLSWDYVIVNGEQVRKQSTRTVVRTLPKMNTVTMHEFKNTARRVIAQWREHEYRYNRQFDSMRELREKMPSNHIEIQVDFAEDYVCEVQAGEVQSGHWNAEKVMLHPVVVRYKEHDAGPTITKSFVYTSKVTKHNAEMVWAILQQFWTKDFPAHVGQDFIDNLERVHYVSDSPFSQYRNRFMFFLIATHHIHFGVKASWNYLESGHGKGACDGVGGTAKRIAAQASKHGHMIADFDSFWAFMSSLEDSAITFRQITVEMYLKSLADVRVLRNLPMDENLGIAKKVHAIKPGPAGDRFAIYWRRVSCHCDDCIDDDLTNCTIVDGTKWDSKKLFISGVSRSFQNRRTCNRCRLFCMC